MKSRGDYLVRKLNTEVRASRDGLEVTLTQRRDHLLMTNVSSLTALQSGSVSLREGAGKNRKELPPQWNFIDPAKIQKVKEK